MHTLEAIERRRLIDLYRDGARAVAEAVESLSPAELSSLSAGAVSAREVIHHICEAELVEGIRLRRILSEDNPVLPLPHDEEHTPRVTYERAIETSVGVHGSAVLASANLLARLTDEEWLRAGHHGPDERYTVEDWLLKMSRHAHVHASQILRAAGRDA